ncbi:PDR/VanB family oxidoreductase [Achromobacter aegrifaciens]|uniref:PDR/VanB family oxidoreductase n=1 Tax=Achromobacter TaxID=222 RepID=UPI0021578512|nr:MULTISPECIES: PDR/VanB family oxidoreductase [Achromobacter]WLW63503.1 PDR/VanB family oxidoreductase [Achromobacter aegrifaciens]
MVELASGRETANWQPMRLAQRQRIAENIYAMTLACEQGAPLPDIAPGDHIEVQVPGGTRAYSLCNPADSRDGYHLAIHCASAHGVAHYLCERHAIGAPLLVRGPRNLFALSPQHRRVVLIAGGIGITPIIAMAEHLARRGLDFAMHYCARSRAAAAFLDRLDGGACRHQVRYHFDDEPEDGRLDLDRLFAGLGPDQHVYLCGPNAMLSDAVASAERHGLAGRLHYERFGTSRPPAAQTAAEGTFAVLAARSGRRVDVPSDCSIATALARAGVEVPLSCEQGVCGMCLTRVIDGVPDHRDDVLSAAERAANDLILPCVSRAKSASLTLDL